MAVGTFRRLPGPGTGFVSDGLLSSTPPQDGHLGGAALLLTQSIAFLLARQRIIYYNMRVYVILYQNSENSTLWDEALGPFCIADVIIYGNTVTGKKGNSEMRTKFWAILYWQEQYYLNCHGIDSNVIG